MLWLLSPQIPDKSGESSENDWESDYCHSLEESEEQPSFHLGNKTTDDNPSSQNVAGISGTIVWLGYFATSWSSVLIHVYCYPKSTCLFKLGLQGSWRLTYRYICIYKTVN